MLRSGVFAIRLPSSGHPPAVTGKPPVTQPSSFWMINVGVIGVGSEWENYRRALRMLRLPVGIRAVYDAVHARAEQTAATLSTLAATGLNQLASRQDIRAVLLLEAGWAGAANLDVLSRCGKPVFIRPWLPAPASFFEATFERASQSGLMLMPAMWRRFMPSAIRLQELFATDLGQPLRVRFQLKLPEDPTQVSERLVGWLDFSRNLFRAYPQEAHLAVAEDRAVDMTVDYPAAAPQTELRQAVLRISAHGCNAGQLRDRLRAGLFGSSFSSNGRAARDDEDFRIAQVDCECESGRATIRNRTSLTWQLHGESPEAGGRLTEEELSSERTEAQVMLDLFCRRLVGGLVPVADFSDISRALRLVESVL